MNNPLKYTDPTGYQTASAPGAVSWLGGGGGWGESGGWGNVGPHWSHYTDDTSKCRIFSRCSICSFCCSIGINHCKISNFLPEIWNYNGYYMPNVFSDPVWGYRYDRDTKTYYAEHFYGNDEKSTSAQMNAFYVQHNSTRTTDKSGSSVGLMLTLHNGKFSIAGYWDKSGQHYFGMYNNISVIDIADDYYVWNEIAGSDGVLEGIDGVDWSGVANATISMAGGAAEMAVAGGIEYFSIGLATPASGALMLDGSARVFANMQRLYFYLNGNPVLGNACPTSLGGIVGKGVDMAFGVPADKIGFGQAIGSWGNDLISFIAMGGTGNALYDLIRSPSPQSMSNYLFTVGVYPYSMYYDKPNK